MRKTGIFLQILGGLMCAVGGMGGSISFERFINNKMMGNGPAISMNDMVALGLEHAAVALLVTAAGAFLIFYGARVARRAAAASEGPEK
jgi:hypothetical protein